MGLIGAVVIGISCIAPAYTFTAAVGPTASVVGAQIPAIILVGFIPMLLVAFGYRELNSAMPDSGTSFTWVSRAFGPWMMRVFRLLAGAKFLRGTALDPFGRTAERRTERAMIADYERLMRELSATLTPMNHAVAVDLASLPDAIRGYGHIKDASIEAVDADTEQVVRGQAQRMANLGMAGGGVGFARHRLRPGFDT